MSTSEDKNLLRAANQFKTFVSDCGISDGADFTIIEMGFGNGHFLKECELAGMETIGFEVRSDTYKKTKERYPDGNWHLYDGGKVPLEDECCDYLVSFQVLEHVESIDKFLDESIRLLRPGGTMYHVFPNYRSFYEGHFNILWLPFLTKSTGRAYMKLIRKYSEYYETLKLVKPRTVRNALDRHSDKLEIISLGKEEFFDKFNSVQIAKVRQKFLRNVLLWIDRRKYLKKFGLWFIVKCGMYYPLMIIAKKKVKGKE